MEEMNMMPEQYEADENAVSQEMMEDVCADKDIEVREKEAEVMEGGADEAWSREDCETAEAMAKEETEPIVVQSEETPPQIINEPVSEDVPPENILLKEAEIEETKPSEEIETVSDTYHYPSLVSLEARVLEYNELAIKFTQEGNFDKALTYMNQAVELQKKDSGEMTGRMISLLGNIGKIYYLKGDQQTWLSYSEKILEMKKKVYGVNHEQTAESFEELGKVYLEMDKPIKGLVFLERALDIRRKVSGEDDAGTADVLDTVGACYMKAEIAEGLELREKALDIRLRTLGQEHEKTAKSYDELGDCYWNAGDVLLGLEYKEKAADVRIKLGLESLDISESYRLLSGYCEETDKKERALYYLKRAVAIRVKLLPEPDEELLLDYELLSRYCNETQDAQGALEYTKLAKKVKRTLTWKKRLPWKRRKHKVVED